MGPINRTNPDVQTYVALASALVSNEKSYLDASVQENISTSILTSMQILSDEWHVATPREVAALLLRDDAGATSELATVRTAVAPFDAMQRFMTRFEITARPRPQ